MEKTPLKKQEAVYKVVKNLMYAHGARFRKKHGNYLVRYGKKNQVLIMDTWNGAIDMGHCTEALQDGEFGPVGRVDYHSHISAPEWGRELDMDVAIDMYKTILATI